MGLVKDFIDRLLKRGISVSWKCDWPGEKGLPPARHPSAIKRTDALRDIMEADDKRKKKNKDNNTCCGECDR